MMPAAVMDTAATDAEPVTPAGFSAPYARSWVNILIDRIDRLPGPAGLAYLVLLVPALLANAATGWLSGARIGEFRTDQAIWAFALVGSAWLIHHLDGVARAALAAFAPILDVDAATLRQLEYELTVIPARPALLLLLISAIRTTEAFAFQPESEGVAGMSVPALLIRWPYGVVISGLILVLVYHTIRQLRLVARIHALAPRINLFRPAPLYAFSRLTSRTAIGLVALTIPLLVSLSLATSTLDYITIVASFGAILVTAVVAFAWPLGGMHRRMQLEKQRLQAAVGQRIEALFEDLHDTTDRRDFSGADGQNKTLNSLIAERDLVHRLSTWPWQVGTAGAVVSAVLLPIGLWLVTRLLGNIV